MQLRNSLLGAFVLFLLLDLELLALGSALLLVLYFYLRRNPQPAITDYKPELYRAPVDGKVIAVVEENGEHRIDIESSYRDRAVLRFMNNATVTQIVLVHGSYLSKESPLFEKLNEYATVTFQEDDGTLYKVRHRVKNTPLPLELQLKEGQKSLQGMGYGFLCNSITSIYLPKTFHLATLQEGMHVVGGESILARKVTAS